MRLIDADKFINTAIENQTITYTVKDIIELNAKKLEVVFAELKDIVDHQPTVDAVEVVRCKNCKHASMTIGGQCKYCSFWSEMFDANEQLYLDGDDFCSNGERKE